MGLTAWSEIYAKLPISNYIMIYEVDAGLVRQKLAPYFVPRWSLEACWWVINFVWAYKIMGVGFFLSIKMKSISSVVHLGLSFSAWLHSLGWKVLFKWYGPIKPTSQTQTIGCIFLLYQKFWVITDASRFCLIRVDGGHRSRPKIVSKICTSKNP